jgi:hypothetical protein
VNWLVDVNQDQVEVGHGRHGYHKEVMLIFGVNEDLCTASNSRWVVSLINTRVTVVWMADDGQRVPGDILGRVAQKE